MGLARQGEAWQGRGMSDGWDPAGAAWALLFWHREEVAGPTFTANVILQGRILATIDTDGSCWIDGVYPGGHCAGGTTLADAEANFRQGLREILEDMMEASGDEGELRAHVRDFMQTADDETVAEWTAAHRRVRDAGSAPGADAPSLPKYDATDWADLASVGSVQPITAVPAPTASALLAA